MEQRTLNVSWATIWKIFFVAVTAWLFFLGRDVLAALLLAIVISTALDAPVTFLERKHIPRILDTLVVYLAMFFVFGLIVYAFVPIALTEVTNFLTFSGSALEPFTSGLNLNEVFSEVGVNLSKLSDLLFSGEFSALDIAAKLLGGVFSAIAIFVLSFYLTLNHGGVQKFLIAILPSAYEAKAVSLYERVANKIGRWFTGQLFVSVVIGTLTFLGLWALGVKYSLFLGLLAGVLEIVPYVGPIFTGGVAVLIGLGDSVSLALYALILFTAIQQFESHVLFPVVMRYTTTLNPVVVLSALLIGAKVFGIIGLVLAVPVAVFVQELVEDWTETKQSRKGLGL